MKKHNGMRPLDIVVLAKIISYSHDEWKTRHLANDLKISLSEISESLNRSMIGGLLDATKRKVFKKNLLDFLQYGMKYVFPAVVGTTTIGVPTAHSAPFFNKIFIASDVYVWPYQDGVFKGIIIEPLHQSVPLCVQNDQVLYEILAAIDLLRIGRPREVKVAVETLTVLFDTKITNDAPQSSPN